MTNTVATDEVGPESLQALDGASKSIRQNFFVLLITSGVLVGALLVLRLVLTAVPLASVFSNPGRVLIAFDSGDLLTGVAGLLGLVAAIVIAQQAAGPPLGRGHLARAQAAGWNQATGLISSLAAYTSLTLCYLFGWLLLLAAAVVGRLRGTFTMVTIAFLTVAAIGLLSTSRVGPTRVIFETWTTKRFRRSITRIDGRMSDLATEGLNSRTDVSRLKRPGYSSFSPSSSRTHRRTPGGRYSRHRKDSSSASRTVVQRPGARQR